MVRKRKSAARRILGVLLPILAAALIGWLFFTGLSDLDRGQSEQGVQQLEEALRRAAVSCYAAEGCYPTDVQYLRDNYGVQVDDKRYMVHYRVFAENLMPDISVMVLSE